MSSNSDKKPKVNDGSIQELLIAHERKLAQMTRVENDLVNAIYILSGRINYLENRLSSYVAANNVRSMYSDVMFEKVRKRIHGICSRNEDSDSSSDVSISSSESDSSSSSGSTNREDAQNGTNDAVGNDDGNIAENPSRVITVFIDEMKKIIDNDIPGENDTDYRSVTYPLRSVTKMREIYRDTKIDGVERDL